MKVNPNREVTNTAPRSIKAKSGTRSSDADSPDFTAANKLATQLAATPDVRTDEVARAKSLITDPNYPDDKTIRAVARRLADEIEGDPIHIPTSNSPKVS